MPLLQARAFMESHLSTSSKYILRRTFNRHGYSWRDTSLNLYSGVDIMPKFVWRHHYNCHSYSTLAVSFYSFIYFFSVEECSNFLFFIVIDMNDNFTFTIACPCRPNNPASFLPISPEELTSLAHNMKNKSAPLSFCKKFNWFYWTKNTSLVSGQLIVNKLFFS